MDLNYKKLREDFEYLESLIALENQHDLDASRLDLMQNPTKSFAAGFYLASIYLWFEQETIKWVGDPKVDAMIERYAFIYSDRA